MARTKKKQKNSSSFQIVKDSKGFLTIQDTEFNPINIDLHNQYEDIGASMNYCGNTQSFIGSNMKNMGGLSGYIDRAIATNTGINTETNTANTVTNYTPKANSTEITKLAMLNISSIKDKSIDDLKYIISQAETQLENIEKDKKYYQDQIDILNTEKKDLVEKKIPNSEWQNFDYTFPAMFLPDIKAGFVTVCSDRTISSETHKASEIETVLAEKLSWCKSTSTNACPSRKGVCDQNIERTLEQFNNWKTEKIKVWQGYKDRLETIETKLIPNWSLFLDKIEDQKESLLTALSTLRVEFQRASAQIFTQSSTAVVTSQQIGTTGAVHEQNIETTGEYNKQQQDNIARQQNNIAKNLDLMQDPEYVRQLAETEQKKQAETTKKYAIIGAVILVLVVLGYFAMNVKKA